MAGGDGRFALTLNLQSDRAPVCVVVRVTSLGGDAWRDTAFVVRPFTPVAPGVAPDTVRFELRVLLLRRGALVLAALVFDLWAIDVAYGRRRCERRGGEPEMRDGVVCWMHPARARGSKSLEDAGWLGRALHAWRMRSATARATQVARFEITR